MVNLVLLNLILFLTVHFHAVHGYAATHMHITHVLCLKQPIKQSQFALGFPLDSINHYRGEELNESALEMKLQENQTGDASRFLGLYTIILYVHVGIKSTNTI